MTNFDLPIVTISLVRGNALGGGFEIALSGDVIIAEENSVVGSIGIFGGKIILKGLYDKLGINKEVLLTSPHADAESDYRKWTEDEEKAIQKFMDDFYDTHTHTHILPLFHTAKTHTQKDSTQK